MSGLIVKNLDLKKDAYDKMIDVLNNEIISLSSEIRLTNARYKDALIDRNNLFRECVRLRTEIRRHISKIERLKLRRKENVC